MHDLNYDLKQMCHRNRDGSYSKQAARERILTLIANALHRLGFKNLRATSLKPKHVEKLVAATLPAQVAAAVAATAATTEPQKTNGEAR